MGIAALITAACGFAVWAETRSLLLLCERGVFRRTFLKKVTLPFEQVSSVAILRVGSDSLMGKDLITGQQGRSTSLTVSDGSKSVELASGTFGPDTEFEALSQQLTEQIAARLLAQLEKTGGTPLLPGLELRGGKVVGTLEAEASQAPPNTAPPSRVARSQRLELDCEDPR